MLRISHLWAGHKASYARATSSRAFKMFTFLQSLSPQYRPGEATALEMDIIGCNMNELEPQARSKSFPERQDGPVTWALVWGLGQLVFPPHFTTNLLCPLKRAASSKSKEFSFPVFRFPLVKWESWLFSTSEGCCKDITWKKCEALKAWVFRKTSEGINLSLLPDWTALSSFCCWWVEVEIVADIFPLTRC